jgi:hypothetical protein
MTPLRTSARQDRGSGPVSASDRFALELGVLGFFLLCWVVFFSLALSGYPLAGLLRVNLYHLYGLAAIVGWLLGNVFVHRARRWGKKTARRLFLVFLLSPGGLFYLVWALQPEPQRLAVPFAPIYGFGVFAVFFLVPVSFRNSFRNAGR